MPSATIGFLKIMLPGTVTGFIVAKISKRSNVPAIESAIICPARWVTLTPCPEYPWEKKTFEDILPNCGSRLSFTPIWSV